MTSEIKIATTEDDILRCWEVIHSLRPHLNKEQLLPMVKVMEEEEGFTIIFIEEENKAVAFAGFRRMQRLFTGRIIYIDDLATLPEFRGKGYARKLLDYVIRLAKLENLEGVNLDSGPMRFEAHRLYLNAGFKISAHHFSLRFSERQRT